MSDDQKLTVGELRRLLSGLSDAPPPFSAAEDIAGIKHMFQHRPSVLRRLESERADDRHSAARHMPAPETGLACDNSKQSFIC
jgi:hypothetical protein